MAKGSSAKVIEFGAAKKKRKEPPKPPKAYQFTGQSPELRELRAAASAAGLSVSHLSTGSGNSRSCVGNWFSGKTKRALSTTYGAAILQIPGAVGWDWKQRKIIYDK